MRTVQSWTCELGYGADTMFHRMYFLLKIFFRCRLLLSTLLLMLYYCAVNMMDHAKVSMKDFELLKVLGTGGQCLVTLQCILSVTLLQC